MTGLDEATAGRLEGVCVVVTRPARQAMEWVEPLRDLGADVICFDTIEIKPVEPNSAELADLLKVSDFDGVVFTSSNAVARAVQVWRHEGVSLDELERTQIIAVGSRTCAALQEHGISADLVPKTFNQDGILQALADQSMDGKRFLFPRARRVRAVLSKTFPSLGAELHGVVLYETVPRAPRPGDAELLSSLDASCYVTFTSPSTVHGWFQLMGDQAGRELLDRANSVALGPTTSSALSSRGIVDHVTANLPSLDGIIEVIEGTKSQTS